ncbi:MAG: sulfur carrier protein ThiS [Thermomicrobiales bacterium]
MSQSKTVMEVELNGKPIEIPENSTIGELLDGREIERRMVAVELNGEIIPRYDFDSTEIHAGDHLELLQMVGGG